MSATTKAKQEKELNIKIGEVYQNEDELKIIKIGNNPSKKSVTIFTDPECPACRKELANIRSTLAKNNVEMIMVLVHGDSAADKIIQIYKEMPSAKNDNDKIRILNKYYAQNAKTPVATNEEREILKDKTRKYAKAGLSLTPYKVETSKLFKKD